MSEYITLCRTDAIAEGQGETFQVGDRLVAVLNDAGEYFAIDDVCPHMGASLGAGCVEEGSVTCPWHAWRFRLSDGAWCDNPSLGVDSFDLRIIDGQIQVRLTSQTQPPSQSPAEVNLDAKRNDGEANSPA